MYVVNPRLWLTIAFALATLVAPGLHVHGDGERETPEVLAGCEDDGVHLAGHTDAPDLSHVVDLCPGCQVQAENATDPQRVQIAEMTPSHAWPFQSDPSVDPSTPRHHPSRAPPLA